jgi:hypothetical protein
LPTSANTPLGDIFELTALHIETNGGGTPINHHGSFHQASKLQWIFRHKWLQGFFLDHDAIETLWASASVDSTEETLLAGAVKVELLRNRDFPTVEQCDKELPGGLVLPERGLLFEHLYRLMEVNRGWIIRMIVQAVMATMKARIQSADRNKTNRTPRTASPGSAKSKNPHYKRIYKEMKKVGAIKPDGSARLDSKTLDQLVEHLDRAGIPLPSNTSWTMGDSKNRTWEEALLLSKDKVKAYLSNVPKRV